MTKELYLEDSYRFSCTSQIIALHELRNKVTVAQTVVYPGGGGQPADQGLIIAAGIQHRIIQLDKDEHNHAIYMIDGTLPESVKEIQIQIDEEKRRQHMRYHTLLHLLSGYFYQEFGALATSSQIATDYARLELTFSEDRLPEKLDQAELETYLNAVAQAGHPVSIRTVNKDLLAQSTGLLKTVKNLLPEHVAEVRVVKIRGIDEQACGGTHLHDTREIGAFQLLQLKNKGRLKKRIKVAL